MTIAPPRKRPKRVAKNVVIMPTEVDLLCPMCEARFSAAMKPGRKLTCPDCGFKGTMPDAGQDKRT